MDGSKMPICTKRSIARSRTVIATTGVPRIITRLVAYWAQTNSGRRNQVIPGARIVCTVTMKFKPVRIEENPLIKIPSPTAITYVLENVELYGA
jgi:hypothetical protein